MEQFTEHDTSQELTEQQKILSRELFLRRWQKIEPTEYEVWKTTYVDTGYDSDIREMIADAYLINLQEQRRFPNPKQFLFMIDTILQEKDVKKRKKLIDDFVNQPDSNPRTSSRRVGRFKEDAISA